MRDQVFIFVYAFYGVEHQDMYHDKQKIKWNNQILINNLNSVLDLTLTYNATSKEWHNTRRSSNTLVNVPRVLYGWYYIITRCVRTYRSDINTGNAIIFNVKITIFRRQVDDKN